ncbi:hypothetical protein [Zooshikella harenae]|nr:hypothetical protein [Zooshikella harenae]
MNTCGNAMYASGRQRLDNAHRTGCRKEAATKPSGKDSRQRYADV